MFTLTDGQVTVAVSPHGAELCSIKRNEVEYLWQADPAFWKRHSPVLFPIVGSLWNGTFRYCGREYGMSQHGFARDREFELISQSDNEIMFALDSDDASREVYPFDFRLEIGYRLEHGKIKVLWTVKNKGNDRMFYQIGAHPAFYFPDFDVEAEKNGYFSFEKKGEPVSDLEYILIKEKGCADVERKHRIHLEKGLMPVAVNTFDDDALIVENTQVDKVVLHAPSGKPWLALSFDAPLVGLWSPPAKNAPFICIEPWYGRCDRAGFEGEISERDWIQSLASGESFSCCYTIEVY